MIFSESLTEGRLIRRYKRFLADVELEDGRLITAHTANTGAMTGCAEPGSRVWLSFHNKPTRKYPFSWELIEVSTKVGPVLVGINTMLSNLLVREAIEQGVIDELQSYSKISTEVPYGQENSRIDLLLAGSGKKDCYVEVKNLTLVEGEVGYFPDALSKRASKHVRELVKIVKGGQRGAIVYCVQRGDVGQVQAAAHIDPDYAQTLQQAVNFGVEVFAYGANVSPQGIKLQYPIPVVVN
jgi:sugar fermentation stimulation protein A